MHVVSIDPLHNFSREIGQKDIGNLLGPLNMMVGEKMPFLAITFP